MTLLFIVLLCAQAALVLVTIFTVLFRKPTAARPAPVWSSLAISLLVVAMASFGMAENHTGAIGAEVLRFGGAVLLGLGLGMGLIAIRARRSQPIP